MAGLPDSEKKFEDMYNRLDRIPACELMNRRTDRQTDILRSSVYAYVSRGENCSSIMDEFSPIYNAPCSA